jgi:hypothetical protein
VASVAASISAGSTSGIALSLDLLTRDRVAHFAGEPLPRCLLRHADCVADLSPTPARLSCLADRLPHRLFQRGPCAAALTQRLKRMRLPVPERPQPQVVPVSDDAHARRAKCQSRLLPRQVFLTENLPFSSEPKTASRDLTGRIVKIDITVCREDMSRSADFRTETSRRGRRFLVEFAKSLIDVFELDVIA